MRKEVIKKTSKFSAILLLCKLELSEENLAYKSLFSVQINSFSFLSTQILTEKIEVNTFKSTGKDVNGVCLLCPLESSDHIQFITLYIVAGIPSTRFSHLSSLSRATDISILA